MFQYGDRLRAGARGLAILLCSSALTIPASFLGAAQRGAYAAEGYAAGRTLVFIDADVRDVETLVRDLPANVAVELIQPGPDVFARMAERAARHGKLDSIQIVSHAQAGRLILGGRGYDAAALERRTGALKRLGEALAPGGDILLLGCDLAASAQGEAFVGAFARATGADVAASSDGTGAFGLGGDWSLERRIGDVSATIALAPESLFAWGDLLTISVSTVASATALRDALATPGSNGVTYSGTPTISGAVSSNAYGTFSTTGSNLGMTSGAIIGTGNITQVPGVPGTFWDGAGTGVTGAGSERDVAQLNFAFSPNTGVNKLVFQFVMGSEEYNEYVGQGFSDNIRILMSGGAYSNTNFAVVPGTSTGVDIDTINNSLNSSYYRDNTVASPPVPDSVLDGHTTVINSVVPVVPGTSYTATIAVADFIDNRYNSASFIGYFGSSIKLDLDGNNSSGATGANYITSYAQGAAGVSVADTDRVVVNLDATSSITSATITLTNAQTDDVLSIGSLPSGISGSVDTSTPGVIRVTLTGSSSAANYQTAINAVTFSNANYAMSTVARTVTVVVNDGATNSNTGTTTINTSLPNANLVTVKTRSSADATPAVGDTVTYAVTITNNGSGNAGNVTLTDTLPGGLTATVNNGTVTAGTYAAGVWTISGLANGASATLTLQGTVNAAANGTTITNTTTAATSNRTDPTTVGDDLTETVTVVAVVANNDNFSATPVNGTSGGATATVFSNDTFDGAGIVAANVTPTLTANGGLTGATINANGTISVPAGTTSGTYTLTYQICRTAAQADCDTATATVVVATSPPTGGTVCTGTNLAVNGGIETPAYPAPASSNMASPTGVTGWSTNDTAIEIWESGFNGVPSHTGNQFMEMNANIGTSVLVQTPSAIHARAQIDAFWAHRGRNGNDTARMTIADNGGGSTTSPNFTSGNTAWTNQSLIHVATATASSLTLTFDSISSTGGAGLGNFIDTVEVCQTYVTLAKSEASRTDVDASTTDTAGDTITYQYAIANPAGNNRSLASVSITDDKIGTVNVGAPLSGDTNTNGFLDPGETWIAQATYTITQANMDAGSVVNIAYASASTGSNTIRSDNSQVTATLTRAPALAVAKAAYEGGLPPALGGSGTAVAPNRPKGTVVTYTYTITNTGNTTVSNVTVADAHDGLGSPLPTPGGETPVSVPNGSTDGGVNGTWDTLRPGDQIAFTATYTLDQLDVDQRQ